MKLVRDKIPEIIEANGERPVVRILEDDGEYDQALMDKAYEELAELEQARSLEELADLQTVIDAIRVRMGYSPEELVAEQQRKTEQRGGFEGRVYLEEVI